MLFIIILYLLSNYFTNNELISLTIMCFQIGPFCTTEKQARPEFFNRCSCNIYYVPLITERNKYERAQK